MRVYRPVYVCTDPAGNDHRRSGGRQLGLADEGTASDEDDSAAEAAQQARRDTIANNKAWRQAEPVRRAWLTALLARKTAPKGTAAFLATSTWTGDRQPRDHRPLASELLGGTATDLPAFAENATETRAMVIALAVLIAGYEGALRVDTWRSATAADRRYLTWLQANGYPLSEMEELAARDS